MTSCAAKKIFRLIYLVCHNGLHILLAQWVNAKDMNWLSLADIGKFSYIASSMPIDSAAGYTYLGLIQPHQASDNGIYDVMALSFSTHLIEAIQIKSLSLQSFDREVKELTNGQVLSIMFLNCCFLKRCGFT